MKNVHVPRFCSLTLREIGTRLLARWSEGKSHCAVGESAAQAFVLDYKRGEALFGGDQVLFDHGQLLPQLHVL